MSDFNTIVSNDTFEEFLSGSLSMYSAEGFCDFLKTDVSILLDAPSEMLNDTSVDVTSSTGLSQLRTPSTNRALLAPGMRISESDDYNMVQSMADAHFADFSSIQNIAHARHHLAMPHFLGDAKSASRCHADHGVETNVGYPMAQHISSTPTPQGSPIDSPAPLTPSDLSSYTFMDFGASSCTTSPGFLPVTPERNSLGLSLPSAFDFNPQFVQPFVPYPTAEDVEKLNENTAMDNDSLSASPPVLGLRLPSPSDDFENVSEVAQSMDDHCPSMAEDAYVTPEPTPTRRMIPLPSKTSTIPKFRSKPKSKNAPSMQKKERPVRSAVTNKKVAFYREGSEGLSDGHICPSEDDDEFAAPKLNCHNKRKTVNAASRCSIRAKKTRTDGSSSKSKETSEETSTFVVEEGGEVLRTCDWGEKLWAVNDRGVRRTKWRCFLCLGLIGRRPDLNRHRIGCEKKERAKSGQHDKPDKRDEQFFCLDATLSDGRVWEGCGKEFSRPDAVRRHASSRFKLGRCSTAVRSRARCASAEEYEAKLAARNMMLANMDWRAALPIEEKNRLAWSVVPRMSKDMFV